MLPERRRKQLEQFLDAVKVFGQGFAIKQAQSMLLPHIMEVFSEHDHGDLRAMIYQDYPLVENHTPEGVRSALGKIGSDEDVQQQYQSIVVQTITPENVIRWLENPEEWLDEHEADEQREELQKCAEVLRETSKGEEWLAEQIYAIYRMAGISAEDTSPATANR